MVYPVNKLKWWAEIYSLEEVTPHWLSEVGFGTKSGLPVKENLMTEICHDLGNGESDAEVGGDAKGSIILDLLQKLHVDLHDILLGDHSPGISVGHRLENVITVGQRDWALG